MEIGIRKTHSHNKKSLTSMDMERNIKQIIGDEDEEEYNLPISNREKV